MEWKEVWRYGGCDWGFLVSVGKVGCTRACMNGGIRRADYRYMCDNAT